MRSILGMILVVAVMAGASLSARAENPVKLEGDYQLGGPLDHNGSTTPGRSHLYVSLEGDAAKTLYKSLGVDPIEDACTGYKIKARGNVACYETEQNQRYLCSFSVNLELGAVEAGLGGCF